MPSEPAWEQIQKKTFTKWCNSHLAREFGKETKVENILEDWEDGILLIKLAVSLYKHNEKNPEQALGDMPKLKKMELEAKSRIAKVQNGGRAIRMLERAGVRIRGVQAENLIDHDKVAILGMVWVLILDYAARGLGGGSPSEIKSALLAWVNKKTDGYESVNPPGVKGFTKDWRSGLAWCALIHAHRPEMIDYEACLGRSNADNLEEAFTKAEELGIPRLLDVEDVDCDTIDDKSVLTYVMEYFHRFAHEGLKDGAAQQASDWVQFMRELQERKNDYERRARLLVAWTAEQKGNWENYNFGDTKAEATTAFTDLRSFVTSEKPPQEAEKMDLEALFAEIQTTLKVNNLKPYVPPDGLEPEALEADFNALIAAQQAHGNAVRENRFRFIEEKDNTAAAEIEQRIEESFAHYDENKNGSMSKIEFEAACMEMGIVHKSQEEKDNLFNSVAQGDDTITKEEYAEWMRNKLVVSLDDPEGIKAAFSTIADGNSTISGAQLGTKPLSPDDVEFLKANMPQNEDGSYDYAAFVDLIMGA